MNRENLIQETKDILGLPKDTHDTVLARKMDICKQALCSFKKYRSNSPNVALSLDALTGGKIPATRWLASS